MYDDQRRRRSNCESRKVTAAQGASHHLTHVSLFDHKPHYKGIFIIMDPYKRDICRVTVEHIDGKVLFLIQMSCGSKRHGHRMIVYWS